MNAHRILVGLDGSPREALVLAAVHGSHGYGGLDRVLDTTAARVVNHALCSVFVARW